MGSYAVKMTIVTVIGLPFTVVSSIFASPWLSPLLFVLFIILVGLVFRSSDDHSEGESRVENLAYLSDLMHSDDVELF